MVRFGSAATAAIVGLILMTAPAAAAPKKVPDGPPPAAVTELLNCRNITDSAARLACYDKSAATIGEAVAKKDLVVMDRESVKKTKRGLFGFSDRIADHVPEFAKHAKGNITVLQTITHQAGFPNAVVGKDAWADHKRLREVVCNFPLEFTPGSKVHYHGLTAHWTLGVLIEAVILVSADPPAVMSPPTYMARGPAVAH